MAQLLWWQLSGAEPNHKCIFAWCTNQACNYPASPLENNPVFTDAPGQYAGMQDTVEQRPKCDAPVGGSDPAKTCGSEEGLFQIHSITGPSRTVCKEHFVETWQSYGDSAEPLKRGIVT